MNGLRIVFMGSPDFAIPSLNKIYKSHHHIQGIVTQPDKQKGRGRKFLPSPVKKTALNLSLSPVLQPESLKNRDFISELNSLKADIFVVVAFRILPEIVFTLPPLGTINLHPSLLPKYRGAAPINWTLIKGETETGITTIKISSKVDAGGILLQEKVTVLEDETAGSLHDRLSTIGADLLLQTFNGLASGELKPIPQSDELATPAPKIKKEDCELSFHKPAREVKNWINGLSPYPAAFTYYRNEIFKMYRARVIDQGISGYAAGTIVKITSDSILVACNPGIIEILQLQREGKKVLATPDFLRGFVMKQGTAFGR